MCSYKVFLTEIINELANVRRSETNEFQNKFVSLRNIQRVIPGVRVSSLSHNIHVVRKLATVSMLVLVFEKEFWLGSK